MRISQTDRNDLVFQFIPPEDLAAVFTLFETDDLSKVATAAKKVAKTFGAAEWEPLWETKESAEKTLLENKLAGSFRNNLILLVQKTWVEKADETFKEQVLYKIDQYTTCAHQPDYKTRYETFSETIRDAVFLMFGHQAREKEFTLYALRIDPVFGLFWWLLDEVQSVSKQENFWSEEKCRIFLLLGMSFIANY